MSSIPDETYPHINKSGFQAAEPDSRLLNDTEKMVVDMGRQLMQNEMLESDEQLIRVGLKEDQSAPRYPSTTKQSVTEVNFHSIDDKSQILNHHINSSSNRNCFGAKMVDKTDVTQRINNKAIGQRQMTMVEDFRHGKNGDVEDQISVQRNLNLLEAFKTQ